MQLQTTNLAKKSAKPFPWYRKFRFNAEWNHPLGNLECPYLRRWLLQLGPISFRIHHWISSDDLRNFHDHPWWFLTFVIKGGYTDVSPKGEQRMNRWSVAYRPALHKHSVKVDHVGAWTIMITGPEVRYWGFWVKNKFKKANKYFASFGHHPCS